MDVEKMDMMLEASMDYYPSEWERGCLPVRYQPIGLCAVSRKIGLYLYADNGRHPACFQEISCKWGRGLTFHRICCFVPLYLKSHATACNRRIAELLVGVLGIPPVHCNQPY
jgi:hypothetical protein